MKKKIVLGLVGIVALVAGVAGMAAYEAHVINVTAHIENALRVHTQALDFGTVFPQEWRYESFDVGLSDSFVAQDRVDYVDYDINQKPKCECDVWDTTPAECLEGQYAPVSYIDDKCPTGYTAMLDLCPFLSKEDADSEDNNDTEHPSYFQDTYCEFSSAVAGGTLDHYDYVDSWTVDLKVPPVEGFVGQDWPAGCPTVPQDSQDYGCDLWIEVTDIGAYE